MKCKKCMNYDDCKLRKYRKPSDDSPCKFEIPAVVDASKLEYFIIKDKITHMYYRGGRTVKWGPHFNMTTIFKTRNKAQAVLNDSNLAWDAKEGKCDPEIVQIQIVEVL